MVEARIRIVALAVALAAGACANASSNGTGDTDSGIKPPGTPDANTNTPPVDADPNAPDADPNAPDATPQSGADASMTCPKSPCDLYAQCGCTSGQACDLDNGNLATGGTVCRSVTTAGTETSTCASDTDCAAGYVCLGTTGQCRKYCDSNSACTGAGALCLIQITYGSPSMNVPGATVCTKNCDPLSSAPTSCPSGFACHIYYDSTSMNHLTDCTTKPATGGGDGTTCTYNSDCAAGFDCISLTDSGGTTTTQCKQTCNLASPSCTTGSCMMFNDPQPTIGGTTYGVCI